MFEIIGSFIDNLIIIGGGIFLLTQLKRINKPYIKWIAIVMILMGLFLTGMDIKDKIEKYKTVYNNQNLNTAAQRKVANLAASSGSCSRLIAG